VISQAVKFGITGGVHILSLSSQTANIQREAEAPINHKMREKKPSVAARKSSPEVLSLKGKKKEVSIISNFRITQRKGRLND
jgi:hypothetical protein